ncbi:UDP-N-acetylmuramoyl-L-alanine--D-glutamate ligase [Psychroflexus planctonicus]|uniref:UDP-N-acetylmuramoylalanine--D-glutamate ligase n=1 Tax=Psychroflexus planctonicus TaxID=1526575 RepID=A0ABQ1SJM0_9FLAO|nr:UDP-N-acetylmuramoyl-L-alanine--D-glutamate ligase [Psychroflexus planctonicus]GGE39707.1 UDP-N-acetylmuramoylalanine--D-glutamate ligase [Psychroflexus planctonicus]
MQKLSILGGGESGVGAAVLAKQQGYAVFVSDKSTIKTKYKAILDEHEIPWENGKHTEEKILSAPTIVKSPGIPEHVPIVQKAIEKGIAVISEIEFAFGFTKSTLIGITGSNGKTTVTNMIYHILKNAGLSVSMAGNIGDSFAYQVATNPKEIYVLELSSFQLDGIVNFRPNIAVITSITPDHLDRYNYEFEKYIYSKFQITKNQTEEDYLIYNADEESITNWIDHHEVKAQKLPMSSKSISRVNSICKQNNNIEININNKLFSMSLENLNVQGEHNAKNAMASSAVAKLLQIRKHTIRESMESFQGVEHRLEKVSQIDQVTFINDSKATNINATYYALDSMKHPTIWILGGVDKGNDYHELLPLVNEKVKSIICLGVDNSRIIEAYGNVVDELFETTSMQEAVAMAKHLAEANDQVLLSPACASFDLFENYEDRGRQFKDAVRKLA